MSQPTVELTTIEFGQQFRRLYPVVWNSWQPSRVGHRETVHKHPLTESSETSEHAVINVFRVAVFKNLMHAPATLHQRAILWQHLEKDRRNAVASKIFLGSPECAGQPMVSKRAAKMLEIQAEHRLVGEQIEMTNR